MKKIFIVSSKYFDFELNAIKIGGVQTYIKDLSSIFINRNMEVIIYQLDDQEKETSINGVLIKSIFVKSYFGKNKYQILFDNIYSSEHIYIIATDQLDINAPFSNVISIQHGIAFDIPGNMLSKPWSFNAKLQFINKLIRNIKNVNRFDNSINTVCVDYNYYNWYKTLGTIKANHHISIITNYSSTCISKEDFEKKVSQKKKEKKIIFARRFVDYRGTILFINAAKRILKMHEDIHITFAGEGPLKFAIVEAFQDNPNVTLTSFKSEDSVKFHYDFDIAVVPTLYSEGTSLSLCESMAAGCFPIATHVGGMTNMLINEFNGFLIYPDEDELYKALSIAITIDSKKFNRILENAYNTAITAFSKKRWEEEWFNEVKRLMHRQI